MAKVLFDTKEIKTQPINDLFSKLSSGENGLKTSAVKEKTEEYGYNEIGKTRKSYR